MLEMQNANDAVAILHRMLVSSVRKKSRRHFTILLFLSLLYLLNRDGAY